MVYQYCVFYIMFGVFIILYAVAFFITPRLLVFYLLEKKEKRIISALCWAATDERLCTV